MIEKSLVRTFMSLGLLAVVLFTSACATTTAREQAMTGDMSHERHMTGIDSQVADN